MQFTYPQEQPRGDRSRSVKRTQHIFKSGNISKLPHNSLSGQAHAVWARTVIDHIQMNDNYEKISHMTEDDKYTAQMFLSEFILNCTAAESPARVMCQGQVSQRFQEAAQRWDAVSKQTGRAASMEQFFCKEILPVMNETFGKPSDREWNALHNMAMNQDMDL